MLDYVVMVRTVQSLQGRLAGLSFTPALALQSMMAFVVSKGRPCGTCSAGAVYHTVPVLCRWVTSSPARNYRL